MYPVAQYARLSVQKEINDSVLPVSSLEVTDILLSEDKF